MAEDQGEREGKLMEIKMQGTPPIPVCLPSDPIEPDSGDLMTIPDFLNAVRSGCFIDYDGYGNWATKTHYEPSHIVLPSNITKGEGWPSWASHVLWYNR